MATNCEYFTSDDDEGNILGKTEKLRCLPGVGSREVAFEQGLKECRSLLLGG